MVQMGVLIGFVGSRREERRGRNETRKKKKGKRERGRGTAGRVGHKCSAPCRLRRDRQGPPVGVGDADRSRNADKREIDVVDVVPASTRLPRGRVGPVGLDRKSVV